MCQMFFTQGRGIITTPLNMVFCAFMSVSQACRDVYDVCSDVPPQTIMVDTVSLNRMFLLVARQAAQLKSGPALTGLPAEVLEEIARMPLEDIDRVARACKTCMYTLRLDADQLRALARMQDEAASAYSLQAALSRGI